MNGHRRDVIHVASYVVFFFVDPTACTYMHELCCVVSGFFPFFVILDMATGDVLRFFGNYTLKIVGGGATESSITRYSQTQIKNYNSKNGYAVCDVMRRRYSDTQARRRAAAANRFALSFVLPCDQFVQRNVQSAVFVCYLCCPGKVRAWCGRREMSTCRLLTDFRSTITTTMA